MSPRAGGGQCSVGCPSGSKVAILMPPLWSLPSAGWEQLPLPLYPGPRASLYPCQTLNWPRLGEGSGGQGPMFLPTQGTVGPLWEPWGIGTVKEPTEGKLGSPSSRAASNPLTPLPPTLHPTSSSSRAIMAAAPGFHGLGGRSANTLPIGNISL